jgi:hypothetical protein
MQRSRGSDFGALVAAFERLLDHSQSSSWRGSPSELLVQAFATGEEGAASWPNTALGLMRRLARFQRALRAHGLLVERPDDRTITIERRDQDRRLIGSVVEAFVDRQPGNSWTGSSSRLLADLQPFIPDGLRPSWPTTARGLGARLNRLKPWLTGRGICVEHKHSGARLLSIRRTV